MIQYKSGLFKLIPKKKEETFFSKTKSHLKKSVFFLTTRFKETKKKRFSVAIIAQNLK